MNSALSDLLRDVAIAVNRLACALDQPPQDGWKHPPGSDAWQTRSWLTLELPLRARHGIQNELMRRGRSAYDDTLTLAELETWEPALLLQKNFGRKSLGYLREALQIQKATY